MTMQSKTYYVYVVQCADGTLYTGYTDNVERRVAAHNAGKGGSYTRAHRPVSLLIAWQFPTKSAALRAEYAFKRLPRVQKLRVITSVTIYNGGTLAFPLEVNTGL